MLQVLFWISHSQMALIRYYNVSGNDPMLNYHAINTYRGVE